MITKLAVLAAILGAFFLVLKVYNRESARVEKKVSKAAQRKAEEARTVELERDPATGKYRASDDKD